MGPAAWAGAVGRLRLVHPLPSLLNAGLVAALAILAGGAPGMTVLLVLGMLGLQFSIGALNDVIDVEPDRRFKPAKPIPAGLVGRGAAAAVAMAAAVVGLVAASLVGTTAALLATAMLAAGWAYDVWLKHRGLGWVAYAVAFPLLPLYAWHGAVGEWPPRPELLLPVAAIAGPMLQLANGLTDIEHDTRAGLGGLAVRLGRAKAVRLMAMMQLIVNGLAWLSALALSVAEPAAIGLLAGASVVSAAGVWLSASRGQPARQRGWHAQAAGLVLLAVAWLAMAVRSADA